MLLVFNIAIAGNYRTELKPQPGRYNQLMEWQRLHPDEMPPLTKEEEDLIFTRDGLPAPHSGASIKPMDSFKLGSEAAAFVSKYNAEQKKNGFVKMFSKEAQNLYSMPKNAIEDFKLTRGQTLEDINTHLRMNYLDVKMAYQYKAIPVDLIQKEIAFSPESNYTENGWNGAVEFFIPAFDDSVCAYHEVNIKLTGSSAFIPKEVARDDINNKLTTINIEGNEESSYIYKVEWWDKQFKRELDCASKNYSINLKKQIIELAQKIDNNFQ